MVVGRPLRLLLVVAVMVSCAYYNIYWMAKEDYEKIASQVESADFWDPFKRQKLTGENLRLTESCIKRCGKLILLYPKSKWVDDALLLMGNCFTLKGDYTNAIKKYDELLNLYSSSKFAQEAKYMKAYTLVIQGSTQQALILLESMLDRTEDREMHERASYLTGKIYHKKGDCENAIRHFRAYAEAFPDGRVAREVTLNLGICLIKLGRQTEAIEVLEPLAEGTDTDGVVAALQIGRSYRQLGQNEKAVAVFEDISESASLDSLKARARMETAETLLEEGRVDEAITALSIADSLCKDIPDLRAEAVYAKGIVYEKHLRDFNQAGTSYGQVSKSKCRFGRLASERAQALNAVGKYQKALSESAADEALNRFLLAETYLLDLEMADEAIGEYEIVADKFPTNEFAARSMLAMASLLEARSDTLARVHYRNVIDGFPNTVFANIARSRLGLPLTDIITEVPDTASVVDTTYSAAIGPTELVLEDTLKTEESRGVIEGGGEEPAIRDTLKPPEAGVSDTLKSSAPEEIIQEVPGVDVQVDTVFASEAAVHEPVTEDTLASRAYDQDSTGQQEALFPDFKPGFASVITMDHRGRRTVIEKRNHTWIVASEEALPSDPDVIRTIFEQVRSFRRRDLASSNPSDHSVFQVDTMGTFVSIIDTRGDTMAHFVVGKIGPDYRNTYVRDVRSGDVILAQGHLRPLFDRGSRTWQDRQIYSLQPAEILEIGITRPDESVVLRRGRPGDWVIVQPERIACDQDRVADLVAAIGYLKCDDFAGRLPLPESGLDKPDSSLWFTTADGSKERLFFGNGGDAKKVYAKRKDSDVVYLISGRQVKRLLPAFAELREK
jgi:TolA-binding protein